MFWYRVLPILLATRLLRQTGFHPSYLFLPVSFGFNKFNYAVSIFAKLFVQRGFNAFGFFYSIAVFLKPLIVNNNISNHFIFHFFLLSKYLAYIIPLKIMFILELLC